MICAAEHCERQSLKTIPFLTNNNLTVPPLEQEWEPDNHPPSIPPIPPTKEKRPAAHSFIVSSTCTREIVMIHIKHSPLMSVCSQCSVSILLSPSLPPSAGTLRQWRCQCTLTAVDSFSYWHTGNTRLYYFYFIIIGILEADLAMNMINTW